MKRLTADFSRMEGHCWQFINDDPWHWAGTLAGPTGSVYEGKLFCISIKLKGYPFAIPHITFITPIFHPAVSSTDGAVLTPLLIEGLWVPKTTPATIMEELKGLLTDPDSTQKRIQQTSIDGDVPSVSLRNPFAAMLIGSPRFAAEANFWRKFAPDLTEHMDPSRASQYVSDALKMYETQWASAIRGMMERTERLEHQQQLQQKQSSAAPVDLTPRPDELEGWQMEKRIFRVRQRVFNRRHCPECSNAIADASSDFSTGPGPRLLTVRPGVYAWQVQGVLSSAEAKSIVTQAESFGFGNAHSVAGGKENETRYCRNDRVVMQANDADNRELFYRLRNMCTMRREAASTCLMDGGLIGDRQHDWQLHGLNGTWRVYRYAPGQDSPPHLDHATVKAVQRNSAGRVVVSWMSVLIYLSADFEGGGTTFYAQTADQFSRGDSLDASANVRPEVGKALLFFHGPTLKSLVHSGEPVGQNGPKYVLRSDVMYGVPWQASRAPDQRHQYSNRALDHAIAQR
jgi:ubiquitin-protein ligase